MEIKIECLKSITSVEELKNIAPLKEIILAIEKEIVPLNINATSYEELFDVIKTLKQHWSTFQEDVYFKDNNLRYIFALIYMDGITRNRIIGLTDELYEDKEIANKWYKNIARKIHPDSNQSNKEDAEEATKNLLRIYERIKKSFDDNGEV